jgi:8-oxo-dGTP diphosphatase
MVTNEMHNVKAAIALKAIVFNSEGKLLVIQRPKNDYSRSLGWDLPGGGLDNHENPTEGIKREIKEETKLEVTDVTPIATTSFKEEDGCFSVMIAFKALAITDDIKLSDEHIAYKWLTLAGFHASDIPDTYKDFVKI